MFTRLRLRAAPRRRDPAYARCKNLVANEYLWRLGIVSGYSCYVAFLLLPLELYRVLHQVNPRAAVVMVALAAVSAPIAFLNQVHLLDVLTLIGNASLTPEAMAAGVSAHLSTYQNGQLMAQIFWELWPYCSATWFIVQFLPKCSACC
ncbi:MAG: DUF4386 family protein [Gemmatimonadetes bacterium]|nr:DUF4386 family protein [Gemmatimonadota bacterium]